MAISTRLFVYWGVSEIRNGCLENQPKELAVSQKLQSSPFSSLVLNSLVDFGTVSVTPIFVLGGNMDAKGFCDTPHSIVLSKKPSNCRL